MRLERATGVHGAACVRMVEDFEAAGEEYRFNEPDGEDLWWLPVVPASG